MKKGFSLVELSVVLVIIGLLIGVLIAAQSLSTSAKVQAVVSDFGKYKAAAVGYKEKYYYWPGDFPDAGITWQGNNGYRGDGDGKISGCGNTTAPVLSCASSGSTGSISLPGEATLAFQELVYSSFITGSFSDQSSQTVKPDINLPKAPLDIVTSGTLPNPVYYFYYQQLGGVNKNTINISDFNGTDPSGAIKPSQALAIDNKIDDGKANAGFVRGLDNSADFITMHYWCNL